ncbi:hypothetical protein ZWY2020_059738 [Hordeum vulgare]|nr:hypothetical protein ZWY2020_059738 [Hordeum vulgare]
MVIVVVTAAGVEVFTALLLSFHVSTKFRDGATAANLLLAFRAVNFHVGQSMTNLALDIDFFSCVMVDASLCLRNIVMATVDPTLPVDMVAIACITFPSSSRSPTASHDLLHNYPTLASMKMQYIAYSPRNNRSKVTNKILV